MLPERGSCKGHRAPLGCGYSSASRPQCTFPFWTSICAHLLFAHFSAHMLYFREVCRRQVFIYEASYRVFDYLAPNKVPFFQIYSCNITDTHHVEAVYHGIVWNSKHTTKHNKLKATSVALDKEQQIRQACKGTLGNLRRKTIHSKHKKLSEAFLGGKSELGRHRITSFYLFKVIHTHTDMRICIQEISRRLSKILEREVGSGEWKWKACEVGKFLFSFLGLFGFLTQTNMTF